MNILEMESNIADYVRQQLANGAPQPTPFDVASQLGVPVSMADRALRKLNREGSIQFPYNSSTEF